MAVFQKQEVGIRPIGGATSVPDHPVARAMYYLKCICDVLDLSEGNSNLQRFTDYKNYWRLTEGDIDGLTLLLASIKAGELLGKCLFPDEEVCGDSNNKFFELQDVQQNMVIVNDIIIAGQQRRVKKIMFFKQAWLEQNCFTPLSYLAERLKRRKEEADSRNAQRAIAYPPAPSYEHQVIIQSYPPPASYQQQATIQSYPPPASYQQQATIQSFPPPSSYQQQETAAPYPYRQRIEVYPAYHQPKSSCCTIL